MAKNKFFEEKELVFEDRLLSVFCLDKRSEKICKRFLKVIEKENVKKELHKLMNKCKIPQEIMINFQLGRGDLEGFYHVEDDDVSENVVALEMYTKPLIRYSKSDENYDLDNNLVDTFVHELIHNFCRDERKTKRLTDKFMKNLKFD